MGVLLLLAAIVGISYSAGDTLFLKDAQGRSRIYHGVNAVVKMAPWLPTTDSFDPVTSLAAQDIDNLHAWGFTQVRLGVMWPGVMPDGHTVNTTYLARVKQLIEQLAAKGIYSMVDLHQDVLSRKFCGEGVPDALVTPTEDPLLQFPMPVSLPYSVDPATGYPDLSTCLRKIFASYYLTFEVSQLFQDLYDQGSALGEGILAHWSAVSSYLNDTDILGYELINEPAPGNFYKDPKLLLPGVNDKKHLVPLYKRIAKAIRAHDKTHTIFFEPTVSDYWFSGFEPADISDLAPASYSYHVYCASMNHTDDTPKNVALCEVEDEALWTERIADVRRLGVPGFQSEFGAWSGLPKSMQVVDWHCNLCDTELQSWSYWAYKDFNDITTQAQHRDEGFYSVNGTLQLDKLRTLSRTYAYATAGTPTLMYFDRGTGEFAFEYLSDLSVEAPTLVYLNEAIHYPSGFSVVVEPKSAASWVKTETNRLSFTAKQTGPIKIYISKH